MLCYKCKKNNQTLTLDSSLCGPGSIAEEREKGIRQEEGVECNVAISSKLKLFLTVRRKVYKTRKTKVHKTYKTQRDQILRKFTKPLLKVTLGVGGL